MPTSRELYISPSTEDSYIDNNSSITISDWRNSRQPIINGIEISFLGRGESCRSVDLSRDGNSVILGASWGIYRSDSYGTKIWKANVQGEAWTVNIAGNDRTVVVAHGDGTIRWYNMDDGKFLLSLYLHPDDNKWVLWTPSGYYDCSPGAEYLIGWHLNNGPEKAAYFFPASRFRSKYYRPDVIDNILKTYDENEALRKANSINNRKSSQISISRMLPPIVSILRPAAYYETSIDMIGVEYTTQSPNGETISKVKFLIDGRPLESHQEFNKEGSYNVGRKTITIPKRDVVLQILAENRHGWSVPAQVRVKWTGQTQKQHDFLKPTLYVLSVGVSDYANDKYDLRYAAKDATDFANSMKAQKGGLYKDVMVKLLTDQNATKDDILDGLDWIQRETTARDLAMIFIAGHGMNDNVGVFYFLPNDINSGKSSPDRPDVYRIKIYHIIYRRQGSDVCGCLSFGRCNGRQAGSPRYKRTGQ